MEKGFEFKIDFKYPIDQKRDEKLWREFILNFVEASKLTFGGGGDRFGIRGYLDYEESNHSLQSLKKVLISFFRKYKFVGEIWIDGVYISPM
ncbi:MAG: 50S ribosome-binding protein YggL [Chitinophagales bacterium]